MSIEEASSTPGSSIPPGREHDQLFRFYYDKGGIVPAAHLEIRRRSAGAKSLDDVMRYSSGVREARPQLQRRRLQRAAEFVAGASLDDFFRRYVRGREELDYNAASPRRAATADRRGRRGRCRGATPHFGANVRQEGERLLVTNAPRVRGYNFGLYATDQIAPWTATGRHARRLQHARPRTQTERRGAPHRLPRRRAAHARVKPARAPKRTTASSRQKPDARQKRVRVVAASPFPKQ